MELTPARPIAEALPAPDCPVWCETGPQHDSLAGHSSLPCHVDVQHFEVGFALAVNRHDDGEYVGPVELELTLQNRAIEGGASCYLTADDAQRLIDLLAHGINELRVAQVIDRSAAAA